MSVDFDLVVVIPMAGLGSRFTDYGFKTNKYMLPINKDLDPMISKAITTLFPKDELNIKWIFITRTEDPGIPETLRKVVPDCEIVNIDKLTEGPASTVYEIRDILERYRDVKLVVSNSDQVLDYNSKDFLYVCRHYDGCIMTYKPNYPLVIGSIDKHSFVKFDKFGFVIDVAEKTVLSDTALVGVHYYKNCSIFLDSYASMFSKNIRAPNGEFYMSFTYKCMLDLGYSVGTYELNSKEHYYPTGEPRDYFNYLRDHSDYNLSIRPCLDTEKFDCGISYNVHAEGSRIKVSENQYIAVVDGVCVINNETVLEKDKVYNIKPGDNVVFPKKSKVVTFPAEDPDYLDFIIHDKKNFTRGWVIGDFEPTIYNTKKFEIAFLKHPKGENHGHHVHKEADEYNIITSGSMTINDQHISANSLFVINKNEIGCPKFLEDCYIICIKIPSIKGDKYLL
jgi:dTDP-glucose pyrophosphorylase